MERNTRIDVRPGMLYKTVMPYSEVCMHMQIAGKEMIGRLHETGRSVQLFTSEPVPQMFSAPILPGEAGLYQDAHGFYFYVNSSVEVKQ